MRTNEGEGGLGLGGEVGLSNIAMGYPQGGHFPSWKRGEVTHPY